MKKDNMLEKNKCSFCPLKSQRKDLTKRIVIENLNPLEYDVLLHELKDVVKSMNRKYNNEKQKIKVTGC